MTTTSSASHRRRFRTASRRVVRASEAMMDIERECRLNAGLSKLAQYVPAEGKSKEWVAQARSVVVEPSQLGEQACVAAARAPCLTGSEFRHDDIDRPSGIPGFRCEVMARPVCRDADLAAPRRDVGRGGCLGARADAGALRPVHSLAALHAWGAAPLALPGGRDRRDRAGHAVLPELVAARAVVSVLAGIVGGKVFLFQARWLRRFYLVVLLYLVSLLLVWIVPNSFVRVTLPGDVVFL